MSWLRRQRIALISLGATATAAFLVHLWLDVLTLERPDTPDVVAAVDGGAEIAGHTLSLTNRAWDEFEAPAGSRSLSVRLSASPSAAPTICGPLTLTEPRSGRVWLDARSDLDVPYDSGERECLDEESGPYSILAVFLLPEDATGPFALDVPDEDDRVARFTIDP